MKLFLVIAALIFFGSNLSYAQSTDKISISVLKESAKVDNLIYEILNPKVQTLHSYEKPFKGNFMMGIFIKRNDSSIDFSLQISDIKAINRSVNRLLHHEGNLGYFYYKGVNIFVWTPDYFDTFFSKTSEVKSFEFIYNLKKNDLPDDPLGRRSWDFIYKDGHFSLDNTQVVQ